MNNFTEKNFRSVKMVSTDHGRLTPTYLKPSLSKRDLKRIVAEVLG
jgi:hypothetical protein